jgi:hypothetical protein
MASASRSRSNDEVFIMTPFVWQIIFDHSQFNFAIEHCKDMSILFPERKTKLDLSEEQLHQQITDEWKSLTRKADEELLKFLSPMAKKIPDEDRHGPQKACLDSISKSVTAFFNNSFVYFYSLPCYPDLSRVRGIPIEAIALHKFHLDRTALNHFPVVIKRPSPGAILEVWNHYAIKLIDACAACEVLAEAIANSAKILQEKLTLLYGKIPAEIVVRNDINLADYVMSTYVKEIKNELKIATDVLEGRHPRSPHAEAGGE